MRKKPTAKEILRAIIENAERNRTYYVILPNYWPFGNSREDRIAEEMGCDAELWKEVYKLNERYKRFKHYVREVKPEWEFVKKIYYADNSVEVLERNKYGETRQRMVKAPSGDACY